MINILYIFLPAALANLTPTFSKYFKPTPINEKYLGKNKTYIGLLLGMSSSFLVIILQKIFYYPFNYNIFLLGLLLGSGALLGDLVESFIKRRLSIQPGKSFFPFDQLDWILGSILLTYPILKPSLPQIIILILFYGILHVIINYLGYKLKINKNKF